LLTLTGLGYLLIWWFLISTLLKQGKKSFFILGCLKRCCDPAPTYSRVQWKTQSYVVLCKKRFAGLVAFSEICLCQILLIQQCLYARIRRLKHVYVSEEWIKQYSVRENKLLTNNVYVAFRRFNKACVLALRGLNFAWVGEMDKTLSIFS